MINPIVTLTMTCPGCNSPVNYDNTSFECSNNSSCFGFEGDHTYVKIGTAIDTYVYYDFVNSKTEIYYQNNRISALDFIL